MCTVGKRWGVGNTEGSTRPLQEQSEQHRDSNFITRLELSF